MSDIGSNDIDEMTAALEDAFDELALDTVARSSKRLRSGNPKPSQHSSLDQKSERIMTPLSKILNSKRARQSDPEKGGSQLTADEISSIIPAEGMPLDKFMEIVSGSWDDLIAMVPIIAKVARLRNSRIYPKDNTPAEVEKESKLTNIVPPPDGTDGRRYQPLPNYRADNRLLRCRVRELEELNRQQQRQLTQLREHVEELSRRPNADRSPGAIPRYAQTIHNTPARDQGSAAAAHKGEGK